MQQQRSLLASAAIVAPVAASDTGNGSGLIAVEAPLLVEADRIIFDDPRQVGPPSAAGITVIFDLDETLVDARGPVVFVRPHLEMVLSELRAVGCEIILWSAGEFAHVARCLRVIDKANAFFDYVICRGPSWLVQSPACKNIDALVSRRGRCVLVDNSPMCGRLQPHCTIVVPDFVHSHPQAAEDTTLLYVLNIAVRAQLIGTALAAAVTAPQSPLLEAVVSRMPRLVDRAISPSLSSAKSETPPPTQRSDPSDTPLCRKRSLSRLLGGHGLARKRYAQSTDQLTPTAISARSACMTPTVPTPSTPSSCGPVALSSTAGEYTPACSDSIRSHAASCAVGACALPPTPGGQTPTGAMSMGDSGSFRAGDSFRRGRRAPTSPQQQRSEAGRRVPPLDTTALCNTRGVLPDDSTPTTDEREAMDCVLRVQRGSTSPGTTNTIGFLDTCDDMLSGTSCATPMRMNSTNDVALEVDSAATDVSICRHARRNSRDTVDSNDSCVPGCTYTASTILSAASTCTACGGECSDGVCVRCGPRAELSGQLRKLGSAPVVDSRIAAQQWHRVLDALAFNVPRGSGDLSICCADLLRRHPYLTWVEADTIDGPVVYQRLDVCDTAVLASRIGDFQRHFVRASRLLDVDVVVPRATTSAQQRDDDVGNAELIGCRDVSADAWEA